MGVRVRVRVRVRVSESVGVSVECECVRMFMRQSVGNAPLIRMSMDKYENADECAWAGACAC